MSEPPPAAASARKKPLAAIVAVVVAAAAGALLYLNFDRWIGWSTWINGAHTPEFQKKLRAENDPALVARLSKALLDASKGHRTRVSIAHVLIEKNRIGEVEAALKSPDASTRYVALATLASKTYFRKQYVEDASWGVERILLEWVGDADDRHRAEAIAIATDVWREPPAPNGLVGPLRAILASKGESEAEWSARVAAASAVAQYRDCASVPHVVEVAKGDANAQVRLRSLQAVAEFFDDPKATCKDAVPAETVLGVVDAALGSDAAGNALRALRMGAMQVLKAHRDWIPARADRLRSALEGNAEPAERRLALETLVVGEDPTTLSTFAKWFHDPALGVRSSAVSSAEGMKPATDKDAPDVSAVAEACLVGIVRDEPADGSDWGFAHAIGRLRQLAGEWVGFPAAYRQAGSGLTAEIHRRLKDLHKNGKIDDVSREAVADAWWRWLAKRNGLDTDEAVDAARRVRDAFWAKAKAGDRAGAKAALGDSPPGRTALWAYERGWLLR
jgi:hypothetical protein